MKYRWTSRLLRLLIILGALPVALVAVAACKPCPAMVVAYADTDCGFGPLAKKQCEAGGPKEPGDPRDGGVNPRGNGSGKTPCPPPTRGKGGSKKGQKDMSLFGANGTQIRNSKPLLLEKRIDSTYTYRIDAENPNPGVRSGNIHVQLGGKGSTHYYWRPGGRFYTKEGDPLPKRVQQFIDNDPKSQRAIREGLKLLGED